MQKEVDVDQDDTLGIVYFQKIFPLGVEAIKAWAENGTKPANTPGLDFFDTGVNLVTDQPASGVPSIDTAEGMDRCWG